MFNLVTDVSVIFWIPNDDNDKGDEADDSSSSSSNNNNNSTCLFIHLTLAEVAPFIPQTHTTPGVRTQSKDFWHETPCTIPNRIF